MSPDPRINTKKVVVLFGLWLFAMMFCNDMTNYGSVRLGVNIRLDRVVLGLLVIAFLTDESRKRLSWNLEEFLLFSLFLICLVSSVVFGSINAPNNRYLAQLTNFTALPLILFLIARRTSYDEQSVRILSRFLKCVGIYLVITAICEHFHVDALVYPKYILDPNVGLHFERSRGPFGNAVVMGGALCLIFFWVLWEHLNLNRHWLNILLLLALPVAIYFTETRSVWLFFAGSLLILTFFSKELRKPCYLAIFALLLLFFSGIASKFSAYDTTLFYRRQGPIDDRKNIVYASYRMFLAKPILGFGYGNYLKYSDDYFKEIDGVELRGEGEGQHNTLLGLLSELGLIGALPYCALFYLLCHRCQKIVRHSPLNGQMPRSIAATQFALLGGLLIYMQFSDIRFFNFVNCLIFWMAGVTYSISDSMNEQAGPDLIAG